MSLSRDPVFPTLELPSVKFTKITTTSSYHHQNEVLCFVVIVYNGISRDSRP